MALEKITIPKDIFQAHYFALRAQHYDLRHDSDKAMTFYFRAAKLFTSLLKDHPDMSFFPLWSEEARLCIDHVKKLNDNNKNNSPSSLSSELNLETPSVSSELDKQELELRERILRSQIKPDPNLSWADVIGLDQVIEEIQQVVFLPLQRPELLEGRLRAPRTVLLFGPPGCGKTHLIRVLASQVEIPVFIVSAAMLLSKWHGESQKMIRMLYRVAWEKTPSIIFIDEFDGLFGSPSSASKGSDSSITAVQIQKELQQYMDGLFTPPINHTVTIAATNFPWHLQHSQMRRFDRILYIPPPTPEASFQLLNHILKGIPCHISSKQLQWFAHELRGYTPSEIRKICEAARLIAYNDLKQGPTSYNAEISPRPLELDDLKTCSHILTPLLFQKGQEGVGTLAFRKWNDEYGIPPIQYPIQSWEKRFHVPSDDLNPVTLREDG